ncbi:protein WVD2-like 3, partial [Capsicum annuum]|uniref:protein WVD2-like 3 n=1 Tax=Capsicum annuum TaxID=4072 RepID=UPI001FB18313
ELASKTKSSKSQSRPSTAGARATSATENTVRCSRAEVYNRCSTNEHLNVADSPQVSEATVHPSAACCFQLQQAKHPSKPNQIEQDKESVNSCQPVMKQNGSSFSFKTEERARKRKEFFMKLEEKVHAKEEKTRQLQARKQENKEAEIKQLRRNLNFKATPMPAFYREPGRRSEKNKDGQSWEEA